MGRRTDRGSRGSLIAARKRKREECHDRFPACACLRGLCSRCVVRQCADLSRQADQDDRLDRRRQRHRRDHARGGERIAAAAEADAGDREPGRRRRHPRRAGLRARGTGRLQHLRHLSFDDVVQSAALHQAAVQSRHRLHADRAAVLPHRRRVRVDGARREQRRRAEGEGAVGRRAQLRDAGRGLVPGPVPEMDEQPVEHQDRRHTLSRRRPGGAGARRQRCADHALRCRQFHRPARRREGEGVGGRPAGALAGAAQCADAG